MATSSQKFIARNRAPRVQIEYDLEVYGAEKKINLPFVMGVMADLSGKPADLYGFVDRGHLRTGDDWQCEIAHAVMIAGAATRNAGASAFAPAFLVFRPGRGHCPAGSLCVVGNSTERSTLYI